MQDLYTIQKNNSAASEAVVPRLVAQGKYVVCIYDGLNYINHEAFTDEAAAERYLASRQAENNPGEQLSRRFPVVEELAI